MIEVFVEQLRQTSAAEYDGLAQEFRAALRSEFARDQFAARGWTEPTLFNETAAFFCRRYPQAFISRSAFARQHNLGNPELLAAELARIESGGSQPTNAAASAPRIATDATA